MESAEKLFPRTELFADVHAHEKRLGGAFSASAFVHAAAVLLALFIAQLPSRAPEFPQVVPNYDMIFLAEPRSRWRRRRWGQSDP